MDCLTETNGTDCWTFETSAIAIIATAPNDDFTTPRGPQDLTALGANFSSLKLTNTDHFTVLQKLHAAVEAGNDSLVGHLLDTRVDLGVDAFLWEYTPLSRAAGFQRVSTFRMLLARGADPNAQTPAGDPIIFKLIHTRNLRAVEWLLNAGASVNLTGQNRFTAMHQAAKYDLHMVQLVYDKGADVNALSELGTPLSIAAAAGSAEVMDFLVNNGADLYPKTKYTPLFACVLRESVAGIRHLIKLDTDINHPANDDSPNTILHWAIQFGNYPFTKAILEMGARVDVLSDFNTPLHKAVYPYPKVEIIKLLIDYNANLNARDRFGDTPLHTVCSYPTTNVSIVEYMIDKGADIDALDKYAQSSLHNSVFANNINVVKLLVRKKADLNIRTNYENQVIKSAYQAEFDNIRNGLKEYQNMIRVLLKGAVKLKLRIVSGFTALDVAVWFQKVEITEVLLDGGAELNPKDVEWPPLHVATYTGNTALVESLIAHGASTGGTDSVYWTPLHKAAWKGHVNVTKALLERGAAIAALDAYRWTPFHVAARYSRLQVFKILLDVGCDVNQLDLGGFSVLNWAEAGGHPHFLDLLVNKGEELTAAVRYSTRLKVANPEHLEVVRLALDSGADLNHRDQIMGWSTLHWAAATGHMEAVRLLVGRGALRSLKSNLRQTPLYLARYYGNTQVYNYLKRREAVW